MTLDLLVAEGKMHRDWAVALKPVADDIDVVKARLAERALHGEQILPATDAWFRAFQRPFDEVKVLIVGQDPYPTPGHAIGLSFAVDRDVRPLPRSLTNIYRELCDDLGIAPAPHGDLAAWADQGVMLLNRVLTVGANAAGSHRKLGWEAVTEQAITALVARNLPLVAVLWGKDAESLVPLLADTATVISAHPSPLSARGGFFGSRPFSRVNELLALQGAEGVDWHVEVAHES